MNDQKFEQWLQEALATDVTAPEDFTARVMDRVAVMPQEYPKKNTVDKRKLKRMMTALAACAAIVVLIPVGLMMMPMGKSAPAADCAAPEMAMDDAAADMEYFVDEYAAGSDSYNAATERIEEKEEAPADGADAAPADDGMTDGGEAEVQTTADGTPAEDAKEKDDDYGETGIYFSGDKAKMIQAALTEQKLGSLEVVDGCLLYHLTAEETAQVCKMLPDLIKAEGNVCLTLKITE